ncbi:MAG: DUF4189 domain-containing protein [Hyphomicrobium sp.]|uniref:DUF4189 domain-containing protein n=1 Tax=Hyphomicrobium sp. TaxID=82 RepID=UPI001325692A|nr:DUF4189 domain-containing protein [Hyphomicrobium sp.]KAB2941562.1 MAG: DUF4189 domain-containing protein [Hyphomicrobium sp.]MBZ0210245.1 DUF4189 domain-containing protein [Hyphomicrobium sp.]
MLLLRMLHTLLLTIVAAVLLPLPGFDLEARAEPEQPPQLSIAPAPVPEKAPEFGAIAFAPDGSFFSVWKIGSRLEAEEKVRAECAALGRGACEAVSFRGEVCAAIASGRIAKERKITYSGGGLTPSDAERLALGRCNADRRARGTCQLRTTVCGDGRLDSTTARAP